MMTTFSIRVVNLVAVPRLGKFCLPPLRYGMRISVSAHSSRSEMCRGTHPTEHRVPSSGILILARRRVTFENGTHRFLVNRPFRRSIKSSVSIITLTTDFGVADWFVGTMKGVILGIQPRAVLVDITHEIPPGDIRAGAFALAASQRYFPRGTVHLAVVDPGVGSRRRILAVQTQDFVFVGPDNGVLSCALVSEKVKAVHHITNSRFFLNPVSRTFHGRDVFAPVAAYLSAGVAIQKLGPPVRDFLRLDWPGPRIGQDKADGEVIYIDRFGNAMKNIVEGALSA